MSQSKGLNPEAARGKANELSGHLGSIDHLISELGATHRAALHPQSYGIDAGERTIAPWSVGRVLAAKGDLAAARSAAADLIRRVHEEVGTQVVASSNNVSIRGLLSGGGGGGNPKLSKKEMDAMVAIAEAMAGNRASEEDWARLQVFLEKYARDDDAMDDFFDALGGPNTAALLNTLNSRVGWSEDEDAMLLAFAQNIRLGLSTASADWSGPKADAFVDALFEDEASGITNESEPDGVKLNRSEMIAFLFSDADGAPMGEQFALSAAEYADAWEHDNDLQLLFNSYMSHAAGEALHLLEDPNEDHYSWVDVSGRILETLGEYPDSAMEFLSEPGRVDYWFGERNSSFDKFEGVTALWDGAQAATGGPLDPDGTDPVAAQAQAETTSALMAALADNPAFTTENLNEEASGSVARATSLYLAGITEYLWSNDSGVPLSDGAVAYDIHGAGISLITPSVTEEVISRLLGAAGSHYTGANEFNSAITGYQSLYMAMALQDSSLLTGSLERYAMLTAVLDGSSVGATLDSAERADAAMDAGVDSIKDALALIPIPMVSKLLPNAPDTVISLLNLAQRLIVNEGKAEGFESWKESLHTYDSVAALTQNTADAATYAMKMNIAEFAYEAVGAENGIPEPPTQHQYESAYSFGQRWDNWYEANSGALEAGAGMPPGKLGNIATVYGRTAGDATVEGGDTDGG